MLIVARGAAVRWAAPCRGPHCPRVGPAHPTCNEPASAGAVQDRPPAHSPAHPPRRPRTRPPGRRALVGRRARP
eukprot:7914202-Lingulodinium_polyedra.AAC.1